MKFAGAMTLGLVALGLTGQPALAAGDAAKGKLVFARCAVCHGTKAGEKRLGPTMAGVFGRKAGTMPGFAYSPAMKKFAGKWDTRTLDSYLAKPMTTVPGTRMAFAGIPSATDRANVIAYLQTLK